MTDISFNIGHYHFRTFRGASWLKIFYHNVALGGDFTNESEARHVISQYKYSILDEIEQLGDLAKFRR